MSHSYQKQVVRYIVLLVSFISGRTVRAKGQSIPPHSSFLAECRTLIKQLLFTTIRYELVVRGAIVSRYPVQ